MQNLVEYYYRSHPTKKWGLKFEPSVQPYYHDDSDWVDLCTNCHPTDGTFSGANRETLKAEIEPWMRLIVEIGVSRDGWEISSTKILLDNKHEDCSYIGIDIEDRSWIQQKGTNVKFLQHSSWDIQYLMKHVTEAGEWIDLLFIDGDHSVNSVMKEWEYAKFVRPDGGKIILHDTNFHPGPWCLFEAIDTDLFDVSKYCENYNDFGIGVLKRK